MKSWITSMLVLVLVVGVALPALSQNPFTKPAEPRPEIVAPAPGKRFLAKFIVWQQQLKQNLTVLIRQAKTGEAIQPLLLLMGLALAYGLLHAAGPGHGKSVATAYILSHPVSIPGGLRFSGFFALIHGFSGAVAVLGLHFIIQQSVSGTLDTVTTVTRLVSFGLITLLGLSIFLKHLWAVRKTPTPAEDAQATTVSGKGLLTWAGTIGLIPCPAVVMVMLFCLSMDVLLLGILLAICISLGMALTVSGVATAVIIGKTGAQKTIFRHHARGLETALGLLSGAAITAFGAIFLIAASGIS